MSRLLGLSTGALKLGSNADLCVPYDPCEEFVRPVPVGSSRVESVDRDVCPKHVAGATLRIDLR